MAFRKFGTLTPDNRVSRIIASEECAGGSTGHKLILTVEYEREEAGLETELFVKFSRDFADPIRDQGRHEMASEVRLAALARHPNFPICVPRTYFADYETSSGSGLLITSRIAFGANGIEPQHYKCADHLLADPLAYYRTILSALARLAAAHKSGAFGEEVDRYFPFDAASQSAADPIPWNEDTLRSLIGSYAEFAKRSPELLPAKLSEPGFLTAFEHEAITVLAHDAAIRRFLHSAPDYVALCHWNAQLDNAWFWRDTDGELRCGLLDWGRVRQMNLAYALWGCLVGADVWVWERHLDELLTAFIDELHAHGGPLLNLSELRLHLLLYAATIGLSGILIAPDRILMRLPEVTRATGPRDPMFDHCEEARGFLHILTVFLELWHGSDIRSAVSRTVGGAGTCDRPEA